jgi:hypothetical protein
MAITLPSQAFAKLTTFSDLVKLRRASQIEVTIPSRQR